MPKAQKTKFSPKNALGLLAKPVSWISAEAAIVTGILSLPAALITFVIGSAIQGPNFAEDIRESTTTVFNETSYRLVDDDTVEVVNGRTVHEYNFDGHVLTVKEHEDDVLEARKNPDATNDIVDSYMVRFEDMENQDADDNALQAGIIISQQLAEAFEGVSNRFFVYGEDELKEKYLEDAQAFIKDHGTDAIDQSSIHGPPTPTNNGR